MVWCGIILGSCGAGDARDVHDFVELLPRASVTRESPLLDFGTVSTRGHLYSGWSRDGVAADGTTFTWGVEERSSLHFFLAEPRNLTLTFRCWPFSYPGAPSQGLSLRINGYDVGSMELETTALEYRIEVRAEDLVSGTNELEVAYLHHRSPSEVLPGATDDRRLAVGWDWLRIGEEARTRAPFARGGGRSASVMLPNHLRLEYQLDVPIESSLVIDNVRLWESEEEAEATSLQVTVQSKSGRTVEEFEIPGHVDFPIPVSSLQRVVVSLQARGVPGPSGGDAGIRLVRPAIRSTSSPKLSETPPRVERPNILLYVIDALRADHLGCYGYSSPSPRIDAFAQQATLFETAYAQSSWTKSSVASIMSGLLPRAHTANRRGDALPPGIDTLAERLNRLGYATAGFVTNPNLASAFGFDQGFDTYELLVEEDPQRGYIRSDALNLRGIEWLENRRPAEPFFLYMHSMDPHDPYLSGASKGEPADAIGTMEFMTALEDGRITPSNEIRKRLLELYDSEIAFNDQHFGRLLDWLQRVELYGSTLIVLVSDHGEEFEDHGWWRHGKTLYQEQLGGSPHREMAGRARRRGSAGGCGSARRPATDVDVLPGRGVDARSSWAKSVGWTGNASCLRLPQSGRTRARKRRLPEPEAHSLCIVRSAAAAAPGFRPRLGCCRVTKPGI